MTNMIVKAAFILFVPGLLVPKTEAVTTKDCSVTSSLLYHSSQTTWTTARDSCADSTGVLPVFGANSPSKCISQVKRRIGLRRTNEIWTGDYNTFDVIIPRNNGRKNLTGLLCVAATLTKLQFLPDSTEYAFNLTATGCSMRHKVICKCDLENNRASIFVSKSSTSDWLSADGTCRSKDARCGLWEPRFTLHRVAEDRRIGHVTVTLGGSQIYVETREQYWINGMVEERYGEMTANENVFECGYITYSQPRVLYGPCNTHRGFICTIGNPGNGSSLNSTGASEDDLQPDKSTTGPGAYVGIVLAVLFVFGTGILAFWFWRRRQNKHQEPVMRAEGIGRTPHGGRSFKPAPKNGVADLNESSASPDSKRFTNYIQINPADLDKQTVDNSETQPYASVQLSTRPKVVPNTHAYGYLPMDGLVNESSDEIGGDDMYDSLCHSIRERADFEESTNVYGIASGSDDTSVYSSTLDRKSSRKALMDYDHVTLSHDSGTMNNRVCHSEEVYYNDTKDPIALDNPGYERMEIIS